MASTGGSLRRQAALALALIIGFHLLVVALAGLMIAAPILELLYLQRLHLYALVLPITGVALLKALLPRRAKFVPPGPRVDAASQPELTALVHKVADAVGEEPPAATFLTDDMNAFVTNVGGTLGVGGHRVLAIGVPLMRVLEPEELESVIAHEFGHFHGGDLKLGPLLYQVRGSMGRTIATLDRSVLRRPFMLYAELYLSVTQNLSRHQEHNADLLAARVTSPETTAAALARLPGSSAAFDAYLRNEYDPVLAAGYRPPFLEGFEAFLRSPQVATATAAHEAVAMGTDSHSKFDSHPPIPERIAALGVDATAVRGRPVPTRAAIGILRAPEQVDAQLVAHHLRGNLETLRPLSWDEVAEKLILPNWLDTVAQVLAPVAPQLTPAEVPLTHDALAELGEALTDVTTGRLVRPERESLAYRAVTQLVGAATVAAGFHIENMPGEPIRFRRSDELVDVLALYDAVVAGETPPDRWHELVEAHDIAGSAESLARFAPNRPPSPRAAPPAPAAAALQTSGPAEGDGWLTIAGQDTPPAPAPYAYRDLPPGQGVISTARALVVDAESLTWGDATVRPEQVTDLALASYGDRNGHAKFECRLRTEAGEVAISLTGRKRTLDDWRRAVAAVSSWCHMFVEPRLVDALLERLDATGSVDVAGITIVPAGVMDGTRLVPWSSIADATSDGKKVTVWEVADNLEGGRVLHTAKATTYGAVLLPMLVGAAAQLAPRSAPPVGST